MKRHAGFCTVATIVLVLLALTLTATPARADWSVTATWTRSAGPNLASEECRVAGVVKGTVVPPASTTCSFVLPSLTGQPLVIRSINTQGAYSETTPIALNALPVPAAATGVLVNITYVAP